MYMYRKLVRETILVSPIEELMEVKMWTRRETPEEILNSHLPVG